jgi:hypothetical protein
MSKRESRTLRFARVALVFWGGPLILACLFFQPDANPRWCCLLTDQEMATTFGDAPVNNSCMFTGDCTDGRSGGGNCTRCELSKTYYYCCGNSPKKTCRALVGTQCTAAGKSQVPTTGLWQTISTDCGTCTANGGWMNNPGGGTCSLDNQGSDEC